VEIATVLFDAPHLVEGNLKRTKDSGRSEQERRYGNDLEAAMALDQNQEVANHEISARR
jgi:hypothetical protein